MHKKIVPMIFVFSAGVMAHTPLFNCMDEGDGSILCEGGFSDGSSAANVEIVVKSSDGQIILTSKLDENSEIVFQKPEGAFRVMFNAGEGHNLEISSDNIK